MTYLGLFSLFFVLLGSPVVFIPTVNMNHLRFSPNFHDFVLHNMTSPPHSVQFSCRNRRGFFVVRPIRKKTIVILPFNLNYYGGSFGLRSGSLCLPFGSSSFRLRGSTLCWCSTAIMIVRTIRSGTLTFCK